MNNDFARKAILMNIQTKRSDICGLTISKGKSWSNTNSYYSIFFKIAVDNIHLYFQYISYKNKEFSVDNVLRDIEVFLVNYKNSLNYVSLQVNFLQEQILCKIRFYELEFTKFTKLKILDFIKDFLSNEGSVIDFLNMLENTSFDQLLQKLEL